jgi:hypothetical protein
MAAPPLYYQTWPSFSVAISLADAAVYDGSGGNAVQVCTGTAAGPRDVLYVIIGPTATNTPGNVLRFHKDDGVNKTPVGDFVMPKVLVDPNGARPVLTWRPPAGVLPLKGVAEKLMVSQEKADAAKLLAQCGDMQ